jgi:Holliday junction DNA helicase RuvA
MIASVRGLLLEVTAGACVIEAGGVGYLVQISSNTGKELPAPRQEVVLHTRQVVREDSIALFGFAEREELRLFDLLIGVSGVGPKVALAVLSGLKPAALARAIRGEEIGALTAIPGIGRKTAERLVVELRDKLESIPASTPARDGGVLPKGDRYQDAVAGLVSLGYTAAQARDAVRKASAGESELTLEELVRRALVLLGKSTLLAR